MEQEKNLVKTEKLSQFCGVSLRRIQELTQEKVITPDRRGEKGANLYDFLPSVRAILAYYREKADSRYHKLSSEMEREKLKQIAARRALDELKLDIARQNAHQTADVERVFGALLGRLRTGLLSVPMSVAPLLTSQENVNIISEIIKERIYRALHEITNFDIENFVDMQTEAAEGLEDSDE
jgi:phage terminase Nu1 subunit (DNA packaging protein)